MTGGINDGGRTGGAGGAGGTLGGGAVKDGGPGGRGTLGWASAGTATKALHRKTQRAVTQICPSNGVNLFVAMTGPPSGFLMPNDICAEIRRYINRG